MIAFDKWMYSQHFTSTKKIKISQSVENWLTCDNLLFILKKNPIFEKGEFEVWINMKNLFSKTSESILKFSYVIIPKHDSKFIV